MNEALRLSMYRAGATDEQIAEVERTGRQAIFSWRKSRGLPPRHRAAYHERARIRCSCGAWEGLTLIGLRAHVDSAHPLERQDLPNGHDRRRGRPMGRRGILKKRFWETHFAELGAIVRGELHIVMTPVGTYSKLGRLDEG